MSTKKWRQLAWTLLVGGLTWAAVAQEAKMPVAGQNWTVPAAGLELIWVAPGTFGMGSPTYQEHRDSDETPHQVTLTKGYWLGRYEVTQAEWQVVMGDNPSFFRGTRNPVERVSWEDATAFCMKLTVLERQAGRLPAGYEYRLPTEAEWEYAARGGAQSKGTVYSGADNVREVTWFTGHSGTKTRSVGGKQANELGFHDMSSNVWEWCCDWYGAYPTAAVTDPRGPTEGVSRVRRSGCWYDGADWYRVANRGKAEVHLRLNDTGFRLALAPVEE